MLRGLRALSAQLWSHKQKQVSDIMNTAQTSEFGSQGVENGTPSAPPYSRAVVFRDLVWTSGHLPVGDDGSTPDDFSHQVELTLDNLERTLNEAGASRSTLLKVSVYLADINDLGELNDIYRRRLDGRATRTTVQIAAFRGSKRIEIDAVAHLERCSRDEIRVVE